jgi:putative methyltransferase (TIGR04325 family)
MTLRNTIKLFVPPILLNFVRFVRRGRTSWVYLPQGFQGTPAKGWDQEAVAAVEAARWPRICELTSGSGPLGICHEALSQTTTDYAAHHVIITYGYVVALVSRNRDHISMLDWGGNLGQYWLYAKALVPELAIEYHCKEVPAFASAGARVLPDAHFFSDERECCSRTYDLVVSSGSLQYSEHWKAALDTMASAAGSHLYITRIPTVTRSNSFVVLQLAQSHGYPSEWKSWFLNRDEFLSHVTSLKFRLIREFLVPEEYLPPGAPEKGIYRGFLFQREPEAASRLLETA